ncbi:MAG: hypothetical protein V4543_05105 [Bacteroidota bacterium]
MKHINNSSITFSAAIWDLIKKVPAKELESVLRKAFPQYLEMPEEKTPAKQVKKTALESIRRLPITKPDFDVQDYIREMRDEEYI